MDFQEFPKMSWLSRDIIVSENTVSPPMNCGHANSGLCAECVVELGNKILRQRDEIDALRKNSERWKWVRSNAITLDNFSYYIDDEVEQFVDAQISAALALV